MKQRTSCALLLVAITFLSITAGTDCLSSDRIASTETRTLTRPAAPEGAVCDGVLMSPPGMRGLQTLAVDRRVTRIRIEQTDLAAPAIGRNPNRVFYEGAAIRMPRLIDLTGAHSIRFTVWASGNQRIANAVRFTWVAVGKR